LFAFSPAAHQFGNTFMAEDPPSGFFGLVAMTNAKLRGLGFTGQF